MLSDHNTPENHKSFGENRRARPFIDPAGLVSLFRNGFPVERWGPGGIVVAVSGGPDSVALAHIAIQVARTAQAGVSRPESDAAKKDCQSAGEFPPVCLAHLNHGMRAAESDKDEELVRSLALLNGLDFECGRIPSLSVPHSGIENELRRLRYDFLVRVAQRRGARCIVTAHHRDDNAETLLFRLFRGTSLRGLTGIPFSRPLTEGVSVVRPLLTASRQQILDYLGENQLPFRTDASNLQNGPTRNWIRNHLVPQLIQRFDSSVPAHVVGIAADVTEITELLDQLASQLLASCSPEFSPNSVRLDPGPLHKANPVVTRHVVVRLWQQQAWPQADLTRRQLNSVAAWVLEGNPAIFPEQLPGGIQASLQGNRMIFRRRV